MSFFFIEEILTLGTSTEVSGDAAHHIGTVRRIRKGEEVELQDRSGGRYVARIDEISRRSITVTPLSAAALPDSPAREITLLQTYIAEQKLDLILQKATELGAARIIIWQAEHSPHEMTSDRKAHKQERFEAIMRNACEQCGRPDVPALTFAPSLAEALVHAQGTMIVMLDAGASAAFPSNDPLALIVGPEGGFSASESALCKERGIASVSIGTYTLRAETAAIAGLAKSLS